TRFAHGCSRRSKNWSVPKQGQHGPSKRRLKNGCCPSGARRSLGLTTRAEKRRALGLHHANDLMTAFPAGLIRAIVDAGMVLTAPLFIQGVAIRAVSEG